jgi:hypothetical protein
MIRIDNDFVFRFYDEITNSNRVLNGLDAKKRSERYYSYQRDI